MRIIAGKNKGKRLSDFDYQNIRPTSDIVKEAIFNTIQSDISDSVFLDLFGGTGGVGLEAYSRGADKVYISDINHNSIKVINQNIALLKADNVNVLKGDYQKVLINLSDLGIKFDIIFIDPPYDKDFGLKAIMLINEYNLLADDGFIIFESDKNTKFSFPEYVNIFNEKRYGIKIIRYIDFSENNND